MLKKKRSLKPLPKTLREKNRYTLFEIESEKQLKERELKNALQHVFLSLFGSIGAAKINPRLVEFNPVNGRGIVCFKKGFEEKVRIGLMFLQEVKKNSIRARSLKCSGSLKKLQQSL